MNKLSTCLAVGGVAAVSVIGALMLIAPAPATRRLRTGASSAQPDLGFYAEAMRMGEAEVAAGLLAQERSSNEELLRLAERIEQDHSQLNESLSDASGLSSTGLGLAQQSKLDRLRRLSGSAFDRAWLEHMERGHTRSIALFERASRLATSQEALELIERTLPTLREHAERIEALMDEQPGMRGNPSIELSAGDGDGDDLQGVARSH